jgi:hypothetical protein
MKTKYEEFDAEAACAAMKEEIEWQLEEWKKERQAELNKKMEVLL